MSFWEGKALADLTQDEWEALCDGCARCCLHKVEDDESDTVHYTNIACELLDIQTCRCRKYADRHRLVSDCAQLTPLTVPELWWLPDSCAYRRLAAGEGLQEWHPLITGDPDSPHKAGASVRDKAVSEHEVGMVTELSWEI